MRIELDHRWRVQASCNVEIALSASALWGQMRDFASFCTMDPLHRRVRILPGERGSPATAAALTPRDARLVISHRLFGIGPDRVGRILTWREGRGFAFSDLSTRGNRVGFPHICAYEIQPLDAQRCRLTISARGVWTARWLPRRLVKWWLAFVLRETAGAIRTEMGRFARWRSNQEGRGGAAGRDKAAEPRASAAQDTPLSG